LAKAFLPGAETALTVTALARAVAPAAPALLFAATPVATVAAPAEVALAVVTLAVVALAIIALAVVALAVVALAIVAVIALAVATLALRTLTVAVAALASAAALTVTTLPGAVAAALSVLFRTPRAALVAARLARPRLAVVLSVTALRVPALEVFGVLGPIFVLRVRALAPAARGALRPFVLGRPPALRPEFVLLTAPVAIVSMLSHYCVPSLCDVWMEMKLRRCTRVTRARCQRSKRQSRRANADFSAAARRPAARGRRSRRDTS
jgi:hypothetical protein